MGREVTIKLPSDNNFLLGEKVRISLVDKPRKNLNKLNGFLLLMLPHVKTAQTLYPYLQ